MYFGLSTNAIERRSGFPSQRINAWFRGKSQITEKCLPRLVSAIGLPTEDVVSHIPLGVKASQSKAKKTGLQAACLNRGGLMWLASETGISYGMIRYIANGTHYPGPRFLSAIATALGCCEEAVLGWCCEPDEFPRCGTKFEEFCFSHGLRGASEVHSVCKSKTGGFVIIEKLFQGGSTNITRRTITSLASGIGCSEHDVYVAIGGAKNEVREAILRSGKKISHIADAAGIDRGSLYYAMNGNQFSVRMLGKLALVVDGIKVHEDKLVSRNAAGTFLYLLEEDGGEFYKIGIASNIGKRINSLQTANPRGIKLVSSAKTRHAGVIERELHKRFDASRACGEWFRLSGDDISLVKSVLSLDDLTYSSAMKVINATQEG